MTATRTAEPAQRQAPKPRRLIMRRIAIALACLLVLAILVSPSRLVDLRPAAYLRLPIEALLGAALLLVLPVKARSTAALMLGVASGLLAIIKLIDLGFSVVLDRAFEPVSDWPFLAAGTDFLRESIGTVATITVVTGAIAAAVAILAITTVAIMKLGRLVTQHHTHTTRAVATLAVIWVGLATFGVQAGPDTPAAAHDLYDRLVQVRDGLRDREVFAAEAAVDAFGDIPGDQLLTALHGKDVTLAFVESYGRVAIEDPQLAPQVNAVLHDGERRLGEAGFSSRSAFLTSPTFGGGSWLAHGTLLSGLWIDSQQRYRDLLASDRLTLTSAFRRAGWRTVAVMPAVQKPWPEGVFFDHDKIYAAKDLGYRGPRYSFATMPDQYTLSTFQQRERSTAGHAPLMAQIPLVSSHAPWSPVPPMIDWDRIGDGSAYPAPAGGGGPPEITLRRDRGQVQADYRHAIAYTLTSLISYVETYGDDDLVLVFLGDHQPSTVVTGENASRDVPVTIVARDQTILDRIAGWGWQDGLKPEPDAPVWRMDTFRDRFLTAFGA